MDCQHVEHGLFNPYESAPQHRMDQYSHFWTDTQTMLHMTCIGKSHIYALHMNDVVQ